MSKYELWSNENGEKEYESAYFKFYPIEPTLEEANEAARIMNDTAIDAGNPEVHYFVKEILE